MTSGRILFFIRSLTERLWVKPLSYAIAAVVLVLAARVPDQWQIAKAVPEISAGTIEKLLTVISASMLGVATFAVASMVAAFGAAGSNATPRAFKLVISDSLSQTALSTFIGAFIYSIVGIVAIETSFYGPAGRFTIFVTTLAVFSWVVLTFVRWVDNVARLGRLGNTIDRAERAASTAFSKWIEKSASAKTGAPRAPAAAAALYADTYGYVQHVDLELLQEWAEKHDARAHVLCLPGSFASPGRALLAIEGVKADYLDEDEKKNLQKSFVVDKDRTFSDDPRFALIVLSEIASRALSPAVNDPGTAIDIINRLTRILLQWDGEAAATGAPDRPKLDRVFAPALSEDDIFEDSFAAIARDGVQLAEVGVRLQKSYALLAKANNPQMRRAAKRYSSLSLERALQTLTFEPDLERVRAAASGVAAE